MENLRGNYNNPKTPTIKYFDGNPLPISLGHNRFHSPVPLSPVFDPYELSENFNPPNPVSSPLVQCLRSVSSVPFDGSGGGSRSRSGGARGGFGSPLASIENLLTQPLGSPISVFKTPVKVEEDVIVMDGFLVNPKSGSSRSRGTAPSDSSGGNQREQCRFWEEFGSCRFGSRCMFAHGPEDLRDLSRPNMRPFKTDEICRSFRTGTCSYGSRCQYLHHQEPEKEQVNSAAQSPAARANVARPVTPIEIKHPADGTPVEIKYPADGTPIEIKHPADGTPIDIKHLASGGSSSSTAPASSSSSAPASTATAFGNDDWSPQDDGIETSLPGKAPEGDVGSHIQRVLYGPSTRKRLPVFKQICSDPK